MKENGKQVGTQSSIVWHRRRSGTSSALPATVTDSVFVDVLLYKADKPAECIMKFTW